MPDPALTCVLSPGKEEMSGESVVKLVPAAGDPHPLSFKGTSPSSKYVKLKRGPELYSPPCRR